MSRPSQRSVVLITLAVFIASAAAGFAAVRWYERSTLTRAQEQVRGHLYEVANATAAAIGRHAVQVTALRVFVETQGNRDELDRKFPAFAEGLIANSRGIRALQVIRDGRIAWAYPDTGQVSAKGMNLRESNNPETRMGYRRVMATDSMVLIGPADLAQGGHALIMDYRVRARYDKDIEFVAMLVDPNSVIAEIAGWVKDSTLAVAVYNRDTVQLYATSGRLPRDPITIPVPMRDGDWRVIGGPVAGWTSTIEGLVPVRTAVLLIVALLTILAWQTAGRTARLAAEVASRTESLRQLAEERRATIEQQRDVEKALATSEERLRLALQASHTATFEIDATSGVMVWSEGVGQLVGRDPNSKPDTFEESITYLEPEDARTAAAIFHAACAAPSQGTTEARAVGADGSRVWLQLTWVSRADADGVVRAVVGTMTDISERKHLEEQFLHAQKMQAMGALAGGIAHDFNNLLTVILGAGQMARASADAPHVPEAIRTDLDEVLAAGERASVLTGQLLAFSRRQVVQPKHFDACDLVGGMGTMLRRLVGERIRVETALPGMRVPLYADQGQLTQVVMNLAVNARDAMPNGGVLRISLRTSGRPDGKALPNESLSAEQYAVMSVSDTGTGIDPSIRSLIFDPFFTTKPVGQGTGLGLATVYGIVMQLGGTIRLTSEVGEGSTFDVYVPLSDASSADAPVAVAVANTMEGEGRVVLLAEDELGLRKVIERTLRKAGYTIVVAEDGQSALAASRAFDGHIDLLLSDVVMPGIGGVELAAVLHAERPATKILLMSGYPHGPNPGMQVVSTDLPLVAKPFKPADLLAAARRVLADA